MTSVKNNKPIVFMYGLPERISLPQDSQIANGSNIKCVL